MTPPHPPSTLFPYTTLFRSKVRHQHADGRGDPGIRRNQDGGDGQLAREGVGMQGTGAAEGDEHELARIVDRKSTRLNSSHRCISYAVFCLKKKKKTTKSSTD